MPLVYEKLGIRFIYPDNWTLDESEAQEEEKSVSVYSPGGAFWTVVVHSPTVEPQKLVETAVEAMKQEYADLDAEPVRETIADRKVVGSDLNFYCLDLTNTAIIRSFRTPGATYLVLCQADDREFEQIGPVFEAMTRSLLDAGMQESAL